MFDMFAGWRLGRASNIFSATLYAIRWLTGSQRSRRGRTVTTNFYCISCLPDDTVRPFWTGYKRLGFKFFTSCKHSVAGVQPCTSNPACECVDRVFVSHEENVFFVLADELHRLGGQMKMFASLYSRPVGNILYITAAHMRLNIEFIFINYEQSKVLSLFLL